MNAPIRLHLIANRLYRWGCFGRRLAKLVYWFARIVTLADIDPAATIHPSVVIPHGSGVVIGATACIGAGTRIMPGVVIGARDWANEKRHADIGSGVIIGAGAKILGAVRIGDKARIGANAVVLEDVLDGQMVIGIPARAVGIVQEEAPGPP